MQSLPALCLWRRPCVHLRARQRLSIVICACACLCVWSLFLNASAHDARRANASGKILEGRPPPLLAAETPARGRAFSISIIIPLSSPTPIPFFAFLRFRECCSCVGLGVSTLATFAANTPEHMPIPTNTHQYPPIPLTNTPCGMPFGMGSASAALPAAGGGR